MVGNKKGMVRGKVCVWGGRRAGRRDEKREEGK